MKFINIIRNLLSNTTSSESDVQSISRPQAVSVTQNTPKPQKPPKPRFNEIVVPDRMEPVPQSLYDPSKDGRPDNTIAYFKNGELYNVYPRNKAKSLDEDRGVAYHARYIVSDGVKYDLYDPESIKQIQVPSFNKSGGMPYLTRDMGYLLRMCSGGELRSELAVPLVYKAVSLMIASPIHYNKKDYFRMVAHLWTLGEIKYGDYLLDELNGRLPVMADNYGEMGSQQNFMRQLSFAKEYNQDYLLSSDSRCVCETSAPYCNRLYCISGKDKRFPKLPDFILNQKGLKDVYFHSQYYFEGDKITISKYDKDGNVSDKEVDAIKHSNRPFVDDRNKFEKEIYKNHLEHIAKQNKADDTFYDREHWIQRYYGALEYNQLVDKLGSKAPKSLEGYIKMKNSNSANYQKLVKLAEENGIMIS